MSSGEQQEVLDTRPKPFVFILMPFSPEFDDVYTLGIKPACKNAGAYAERVDEQIHTGSITQRIYHQISKADTIVADMTGKNPNVFYEVGYAHALGKRVVLLAHEKDDIPFDLKDYPHVIYHGRITDLIPELGKRVSWCLEHREDSRLLALSHLSVVHRAEKILDNPVLGAYQGHGKEWRTSISLDIGNSDDRVIRNETLQIAFVTPPFTELADSDHRILPMACPSPGRWIHSYRQSFTLFPAQWVRLDILFRLLPAHGQVSFPAEDRFVDQYSVILSTSEATCAYPFRMIVRGEQEGVSKLATDLNQE